MTMPGSRTSFDNVFAWRRRGRSEDVQQPGVRTAYCKISELQHILAASDGDLYIRDFQLSCIQPLSSQTA